MHKNCQIERFAREIQPTIFSFGVIDNVAKKSWKSTWPFFHTNVNSEAMSGCLNDWSILKSLIDNSKEIYHLKVEFHLHYSFADFHRCSSNCNYHYSWNTGVMAENLSQFCSISFWYLFSEWIFSILYICVTIVIKWNQTCHLKIKFSAFYETWILENPSFPKWFH